MIDITDDFYTNDRGERFRYRQAVPDGYRASVLCVHGLAEHLERYSHVESLFAANGYSFHMIDNRAHGKSVGKRGHVERYDDFVEDVDWFRRNIVEKVSAGKPLFLMGHSNGSLISARYVLKYSEGLKGVVLSGIPIKAAVSPMKKKLGMMMAGVIPNMSIPAGLDAKLVCRDPKVVEAYVNDPMVYTTVTVRFGREFFVAMDDLSARAADFRLPALFLHGGADGICDPVAAKDFYERVSSKDKQFVMFDGMYHEIFNDQEKELPLGAALKWIGERL